MSRLVDRLAERRLVSREARPEDRRCVTLTVTAEGQSVLEAARQSALVEMAKILALLAPHEQDVVRRGLALLERSFSAAMRAE